ncbi:MAG TPA: alpha-amylase family glycosyl hydrolase [Puia sp.]|uniref:alpha-amylase family glycosyl hydrolase n=1 Tax=Puia sp. TaxID=2045100 RepID=UPI002C69CBF8|nr:alpha-amylase family glycosyl hydrolase [Puia sp.]HVU95530.1 alpha-amylase family glycosyl hydrolase [Puia sp.]
MITQDDIVYFVMTDRFVDGDTANNALIDKTLPKKRHGGDLAGIQSKFDYLEHLGVTALWITPVYLNIPGLKDQNTGDPVAIQPYHGYWPKDFERMDDHLYSPDGRYPTGDKRYLKDFVDACHARGLKVILDVVVNHTGYTDGQPIFDASWYKNDGDSDFSGLPKLDLGNSSVVDYFVNNLIDWIATSGIDGLRMDMAKSIGGYSHNGETPVHNPEFNKFWYFYKSIIKGRFPNLFIVGEVLATSSGDVDENATFQNQSDLNSIFDFPLRDAIKNVIVYDHSFREIARPRLSSQEPPGILDLDDPSNGGYYTNSNRLVTLLDNHDLSRRIISEIRTKFTGDDKKAFAFQLAKMLYAFLFTVRGIQQIYYGSELGLEGWKTDNDDSDLRRDFPWAMIDGGNEVAAASFPLEADLNRTIRQLIHFRKSNDALKYGVTITLWVDDLVYAFLRYFRSEVVIAVFNNGYADMPSPLLIPIGAAADKDKQPLPDRIIQLLRQTPLHDIDNPSDTYLVTNGVLSVSVRGKSYKILSY